MASTTVIVFPVPGGPNNKYGAGLPWADTILSTAAICLSFNFALKSRLPNERKWNNTDKKFLNFSSKTLSAINLYTTVDKADNTGKTIALISGKMQLCKLEFTDVSRKTVINNEKRSLFVWL